MHSCPATDLLVEDVDNHHEDSDDVYEDEDNNDDNHIAYQHLHNLGVTPLGRPVQWRELMIIPAQSIVIDEDYCDFYDNVV